MSIESTYDVSRKDAIFMLERKGVTVFEDDCTQRLELLLYENRESIYENYWVHEFDEETVPKDNNSSFRWKSYW